MSVEVQLLMLTLENLEYLRYTLHTYLTLTLIPYPNP